MIELVCNELSEPYGIMKLMIIIIKKIVYNKKFGVIILILQKRKDYSK